METYNNLVSEINLKILVLSVQLCVMSTVTHSLTLEERIVKYFANIHWRKSEKRSIEFIVLYFLLIKIKLDSKKPEMSVSTMLLYL